MQGRTSSNPSEVLRENVGSQFLSLRQSVLEQLTPLDSERAEGRMSPEQHEFAQRCDQVEIAQPPGTVEERSKVPQTRRCLMENQSR